MKAILLAAGYATRLYPLTLDTPKPLLRVGDKRMIEHIISKLEEIEDLDEIHIVTNDKFYRVFWNWARGFRCSKKIILHNDGTSTNEDRLGAIGDIHFAIEKGEIDDDSFILAGDNLFEAALSPMVDSFRKHGRSMIAARDLKEKSLLAGKFGVIVSDKDNVIIDFEEKPKDPKTTLAATMIYLLNKESISELKEVVSGGTQMDNGGDFIKHLAMKGEVLCYTFDSHWIDIGSHDQLNEAHEYMKRLKNRSAILNAV